MVGAAIGNGTAECVNLFQFAFLIATGRPFQRIKSHSVGNAEVLERTEQLSVNGFGQANFSRNAVIEVRKNAFAVHTFRSCRQTQQDARPVIS